MRRIGGPAVLGRRVVVAGRSGGSRTGGGRTGPAAVSARVAPAIVISASVSLIAFAFVRPATATRLAGVLAVVAPVVMASSVPWVGPVAVSIGAAVALRHEKAVDGFLGSGAALCAFLV